MSFFLNIFLIKQTRTFLKWLETIEFECEEKWGRKKFINSRLLQPWIWYIVSGILKSTLRAISRPNAQSACIKTYMDIYINQLTSVPTHFQLCIYFPVRGTFFPTFYVAKLETLSRIKTVNKTFYTVTN